MKKPLTDKEGEVRELTEADFANMQPASEVLGDEFMQMAEQAKQVRGKQKAPTKERVTIRLSPSVVDYFKQGGAGWQTRLDQALQDYISTH